MEKRGPVEWFVDQHRKIHNIAVGTEAGVGSHPAWRGRPSFSSLQVSCLFLPESARESLPEVPWQMPSLLLLGKEPESEQRMLPYHPGGWPKQLQKGLISFTAEKQSFCRCKVASLDPRVLICYSQSPQVAGKLHAIG